MLLVQVRDRETRPAFSGFVTVPCGRTMAPAWENAIWK